MPLTLPNNPGSSIEDVRLTHSARGYYTNKWRTTEVLVDFVAMEYTQI